MRSSQVTIKDIARELGISPSTVSRALKDHPDISPETKKPVNELASGSTIIRMQLPKLKHSKRFTLAIISLKPLHYFSPPDQPGIEEVPRAGYNVEICKQRLTTVNMSNAQMCFSNRVTALLFPGKRYTQLHPFEIFSGQQHSCCFFRPCYRCLSLRQGDYR